MRKLLMAAAILIGLSGCTMNDLSLWQLGQDRTGACQQPALRVDPALMLVAQQRANRLASTEVFAHTANLWDGIPKGYTYTSENIAWARWPAARLQDIEPAYMLSPVHREDICDPRAVAVGVGNAWNATHTTVYNAQVFGGYK